MNKIMALLMVVLAVGNAQAQSLPNVRIRGSITAIDGHGLQVRTREGKDLKVGIADTTKINVLTPLKLKDVKQGSFVGVTAIQHGPGTPLQAREVHLFAPAQRGTGEGHYDWDLEPGSSMTNANVDAIVDTNNGEELKLSYKGGSQQILVSRDVPIVAIKPAAGKSLLKVGAQIFCIAKQAADGSLTAQHISVGEHGLKPPM